MKHAVPLTGCAPIPLAHYLKALGVLRLVSEQRDENAAGFWLKDTFILQSELDESALLDFFENEYRPTPILAPWNGGSGFFSKDNQDAVRAIESTKSPRFDMYADGVGVARALIKELRLKEKPADEQKEELLNRCRNRMPEGVLQWLDAVYAITNERTLYPPLLGTGGNDGRLEFTNNFMQRLLDVIDMRTGGPTGSSRTWLMHSLFATNTQTPVNKGPVGQFFPGAAGGANATSGFDGPSSVNPWDYVLMIEGAVLFASAVTRRLESLGRGNLIYPFCVRQTGVGYSSASLADEDHNRPYEMWMPFWDRPTTMRELKAVFSEGRAQVGGRPARNGVDFARAVVSLGVDRGLSAFQRYGFQVRNGLAYFATPLNRLRVKRNARVDLLSDIDLWLERFRAKSGPQANPPAPASVTRALNQLETRIFDLCKRDTPENTQAVLITLGRCEAAMARSLRWAKENGLRPISGLSPGWLHEAWSATPEFRLAMSLASLTGTYNRDVLSFRKHLESVEIKGRRDETWFDWLEAPGNDLVPARANFALTLNAVFARRLIRVEQSGTRQLLDETHFVASLADVTTFIESTTDDSLLEDLVWGLSLIDWHKVQRRDLPENPQQADFAPSAFYALLKLCFSNGVEGDERVVPLDPAIHRRAMNGDAISASQMAGRRLFTSGRAPAVRDIPVAAHIAQRTAAALIFPLISDQIKILRECVLRRKEPELT